MIRVPHSLADLDAMAKVFYTEVDAELQLKAALSSWPHDELKPLMMYLCNNLDKIVTGRPDELEAEASTIRPLANQAKSDFGNKHPEKLVSKEGKKLTKPAPIEAFLSRWLKGELRKVFNYDTDSCSFISRKESAMAYRHAQRLQMSTCPYCNANFTFTITGKDVKTRPQFDHFLDKSRHPYFALSFFNLIPCCFLCNSGALKGTNEFSIRTHLHPLVDNIEGLYQFRTKVAAVDFLVNGDDFELDLKPCKDATTDEKLRASTSIQAFGLVDRYKNHKDIASDIIKKSYFYNKSTVAALFASFTIDDVKIFTSESEIKELILGNYMHPDNFHKRILSKLTRDIAGEFGLTI